MSAFNDDENLGRLIRSWTPQVPAPKRAIEVVDASRGTPGLATELRDGQAQLVANALGDAEKQWAHFEGLCRSAARRGGRDVLLTPSDGSPMSRAVIAAIAARAKAERFTVARTKVRQSNPFNPFSSQEVTAWRVSW